MEETPNETDKRLIFKIYKHHMQLNTRKITKPIKKWVEEWNRHFSKVDTQKASKHMRKCSIQCHSLLERWKSKLQWCITSHLSECLLFKILQIHASHHHTCRVSWVAFNFLIWFSSVCIFGQDRIRLDMRKGSEVLNCCATSTTFNNVTQGDKKMFYFNFLRLRCINHSFLFSSPN